MTPREAAAPVGRETPRTLRFKQADVSRAIRGAKQAGMTVGRVEIDRDGKIVILSDAAAPEGADAALEKWLAEDARRAQRT